MTGWPAALSALAFASTASVADSLMAAMRREIRRSAGERADVGSVAETAVMGSSCQRRRSLTWVTAAEGANCTVCRPSGCATHRAAGNRWDVGCGCGRSRTLADLGQLTPPPACPGFL